MHPPLQVVWLVSAFHLALAARLVAASEPALHWAFQPLPPVSPPLPRSNAWVHNPIDAFILKELETAGLSPATPASPEQLIRRMTLGLIGLPPAPEEVEAFARDPSPAAQARLVERLLESPHYGERWGRHWLDLARYAESDGFEHDAVRPAAWRYRDYVIQAFNRDKPYNRFIEEQIAGDELWADRPEALIATGFNLLGPDMVDSADPVQRRLNTLNDMTDTMAAVVLGLTFGCARCHDHKSEPITQRDYYQMQAFFAPAEFRWEHPVPTPGERASHQEAMQRYDRLTAGYRQTVAELEDPVRRTLLDEKLSHLSEDAQLAHRTPPSQRTREQEGTVQETAPMLKIADQDVDKAMPQAERARRKKALAKLKRVPKPAALPIAMVLQDSNGPPAKTFVLARGDYNQPREEVAPAIPSALSGTVAEPVPIEAGAARRAALARWLTRNDHPLTARVLVNRVWQHHFGHGLVATASDFGTRGARPSHPELLDWLAAEFIRSGWSIKSLHRLILASATYQQSSSPPPATLTRDPDNRWFSRSQRTRLEGEVIRDSLLAISGRLNRAQFGPSVFPPIPADITRVSKNWTTGAEPADHTRRSLYIFARRNLRFPFLEAFDSPDTNLTCPERGRSTTAPQSLTLLNSEEVLAAARATAERIRSETPDPDRQIELAYRLVLGRRPDHREHTLSQAFVLAQSARAQAPGASLPPTAGADPGQVPSTGSGQVPRHAGLDELCRALFNLNAFVYAD